MINAKVELHTRQIASLKLQNRLLLLLLLVLSLLLLMGQTQRTDQETVRCARLEVVGESGQIISAIGTDEDGSSGLFVYDSESRTRLAAVYDSTQTAIYLLDNEGAIRVGAAHYAHGGSGFALHGDSTKGAAVLYYKENGSLTFYDREGNTTARYPAK